MEWIGETISRTADDREEDGTFFLSPFYLSLSVISHSLLFTTQSLFTLIHNCVGGQFNFLNRFRDGQPRHSMSEWHVELATNKTVT